MSNAQFHTGQTVTISHYTGQDTDTESRQLVGTEQAEIIGAIHHQVGMVWVRPFHGDDFIKVHIRDIAAV